MFALPVVKEPINKGVFLKSVRAGVEELFSRTQTILNNHRMYANILGYYLDKYGINEIVPDEGFFNTMWDRLMSDAYLNGRNYSVHSRKKIARVTRRIVNEYFLPRGIVQRKVLTKIVRKRYERLLALTKKSQDAVIWFEQNGKQVRAMPVLIQNPDGSTSHEMIKTVHRIKNKNLLPVSKSGKIEHALRFLEIVKKNGFEFVINDDVKKLEQYCEERGIAQKEDYLAHVATFFINIHSQGFIKDNPFSAVSLKMNGGAIRKDFISTEGMEKFRDLSSVDFKDKIDVRDRLIIMLAYDLALRLNELLSIDVTDVKKDADGEWHVVLKSDIQKGQGKDEEIMYFFFNETKELLEAYLTEIRKKFSPATNHLIVSNQGGALCSQHCRVRFKDICARMGIKTFYVNIPSPHVLRHSFATINIEPLGLSLPLYEMAQRLRHARVETTRKHYIHSNPYLQKLKHSVYRRKGIKKTTNDILDEIPLADLEHWLSDKLKVDNHIIKDIRKNHKQQLTGIKDDKSDDGVKIYISEEEVCIKLKDLQIPIISLREYANEKGALTGDGSQKYGKVFRYKESFVEELYQNWIYVKTLQKKLRINHNGFYCILKREKWRTLKIGKRLYINRHDCF
jgi:site-specific recombinase XerD